MLQLRGACEIKNHFCFRLSSDKSFRYLATAAQPSLSPEQYTYYSPNSRHKPSDPAWQNQNYQFHLFRVPFAISKN